MSPLKPPSCLVCADSLTDRYEPEGHRKVCGVTNPFEDSGGRVFHQAVEVQYHGGSWNLNVYVARCGATNLTNGNRGRVPCPECFEGET